MARRTFSGSRARHREAETGRERQTRAQRPRRSNAGRSRAGSARRGRGAHPAGAWKRLGRMAGGPVLAGLREELGVRREQVNYLLVGVFVLVSLGVLGAALFLITGRTGPTDGYHVHFTDVTGLRPGTPVYYQGYRVGQVGGITPSRDAAALRYRVDLAVQQDWPVPADSVARMEASGLLSALTINIRGGSAPDLLTPGSEMQGEGGSDVFRVMYDAALAFNDLTEASVRPLLANLNVLAAELAGSLGSEGTLLVQDVRALVRRLEAAAGGAEALLGPDTRSEVATTLGNLREASGHALTASKTAVEVADQARLAAAQLAALTGEVQQTRARLDALIGDARGLVRDGRPQLEQALRDLRRSLEVVSNHVDRIAYNMESTSRNMNEFSRQIRQNPSVLLGGRSGIDGAGRAP